MKAVLSQLSEHDNAILFIDEIHTIVGAGAVSGGSLDASNILKPFLTSSNMKCIGATTYDEYHKHFEKDSALTRRFQKIDIPETTELQTFEILRGLKERYQKFHDVKYTEEALRSACRLSKQYITGRYLPDKAIDVIDEAGAKNSMLKNRKKLLRERDIERVVSGMTKIPEKNISSDESRKLKYLHNSILKNLFGQDHAVEAVVDSIKRQRAGFSNPEKPVASFLFVGPTGVGKTELAKLLSREMGVALHRFDMSEYQEKHAVAKFIGSPPGYVGYEQGGQLTESIRKEPNAVLLLDEIEKAHADIFNTLLQIMDYATLTDNNGKKADFRNVTIIMTSNAGAREMGKAQLGFGDRELNMGELDRAVERIFSPEFRNRVEKIVKFNMLQQSQINRIAKKHLDEFANKLENRGIKLETTPAVYALIGEKGFSEIFGAREIHRTVKNMVEDPLVDDVLFGKLKKGGTIKLCVRKGEIRFSMEEK
ncbi:MAG: AAA family ATPase [bacterium]